MSAFLAFFLFITELIFFVALTAGLTKQDQLLNHKLVEILPENENNH